MASRDMLTLNPRAEWHSGTPETSERRSECAPRYLQRALVAGLGCIWLLVVPSTGLGRDLRVDPQLGDDARDAVNAPVRTIARAIRLAHPGDTIHLQPVVYRDTAAFYDKAGTADQPITLEGHGATLNGCDPLDPTRWSETAPGLYRCDDLLPLTQAIVDRWFFLIDGSLQRMRRCSKGPSEPLKSPESLLPGEWTFVLDEARTKTARAGYIFGSFYLRGKEGETLAAWVARSGIEVPYRMAGVSMHGQCRHLVVRNLTATHVYNDGFNLSDCQDCRFEEIAALDCADDGISAHGDCRYTVDGLTSIGNATGICDTGNSTTSYRGVTIRNCLGFDLFFLDTGTYSVRDAVIDSSAAKAVYLQAREKPAAPCRVTLENVLIRRNATPQEVRVNPNCVLTLDRVSLLGLDVNVVHGEFAARRLFLGGQVAAGMPPDAIHSRSPRVHLWPESTWRGDHNWYAVESIRVGNETFSPSQFAKFAATVAHEDQSRWQPVEVNQIDPQQVGANLPAREPAP
jgi:hypothetical protein